MHLLAVVAVPYPRTTWYCVEVLVLLPAAQCLEYIVSLHLTYNRLLCASTPSSP